MHSQQTSSGIQHALQASCRTVALAVGSRIVACLAGAYPISLLKARLDRVNERVSRRSTRALASAPGGVCEAKSASHVEDRNQRDRRQTSRSVEQGRRTARSAGEIKSQVEKIVGRLQTADLLLQKSMDRSARIARPASGCLIGVPATRSACEDAEKLRRHRTSRERSKSLINGVGDFTVNRDGEKNRKQSTARVS